MQGKCLSNLHDHHRYDSPLKDPCPKADHHEEDVESVLQEDGTYLYVGPKGRLETWRERQARLRHNLKVKFDRSLSI